MEGGKAHLVSARQQTDEVQSVGAICGETPAVRKELLPQVFCSKCPGSPRVGPKPRYSFLWLPGFPWTPYHQRDWFVPHSINDVTSDPTTVAGLLLLLKSYDRNKHSSDQQLAQADLTSTHNLTVIYRHCLDMTRHLTVLRGKKYNLIIISSVMRKVN